MYETYFKFEKSPFRVVPDPSMLFASHSVREAMSRLEFAVRTGKGITVMTGEVGTGKTTLVNRFLDKAGADLQTAYIFNPTLTGLQILKTLADELGVQTYGMAKVDLTRALYELFLRNRQAGRRTLLFVDEAQALTREALEELRLLSNLETWQEKLLHIFLVGQPELLEKLESYNLRQLRQRVELFVQIEPMTATETRQYIEHRIRMANPLRQVSFTDTACQLIHQISGGIPRTINILCDASLLVAYVAETGDVTPAHVRDGVRTIDADQVSMRIAARRRGRFWHRLWGGLAAGLVAVAVLLGALSVLRRPATDAPQTSAPPAVAAARVALVHVHSSTVAGTAEAFAGSIARRSGRHVYLQRVTSDGATWSRVLIGDFPGREAAEAGARELRESGEFAYARAVEVPAAELARVPAADPGAVAAAREGQP